MSEATAVDRDAALLPGGPLEVIDAGVLFRSPSVRRRGTASLARLENGQLLLAFNLRRPQPSSLNGAVMLTRSADLGRSWHEPVPILATPGWSSLPMGLSVIRDDSIRLSLGRVQVDRSLGGDEPFTDWWSGWTETRDQGQTWSEPGSGPALFPFWTELYGPSNPHRLADGNLLWVATGTLGRDVGWMVGVATTDPEGVRFGPLVLVAAAPDRNFADPDLGRLPDGRLVAVMREMVTRTSFVSISGDEGATWSEPAPTGFRGSNHCLVRLRSGALLCAYRDEDPARRGVSASASEDGRLWRSVGQLYRASEPVRHEPTMYCGYPSFVRVNPEELLCVFHTYVDDAGRADLRLLRLQDRS